MTTHDLNLHRHTGIDVRLDAVLLDQVSGLFTAEIHGVIRDLDRRPFCAGVVSAGIESFAAEHLEFG
ncbi:hypothetical protein [Lentzea sp. NPDC004782]|uniref:hypothetical protein n=1 Tax=Lentzea sp. NPDC004782 TaxID=3154458 RepID=UPI0033B447F2